MRGMPGRPQGRRGPPQQYKQGIVLLLAVGALAGGCSNPRYVPGPGMEGANVNVAMARCRLFAESGGTAVSASGPPAFVAGAVVGAAIGNAVRQNRLYNDCMEANGFVAAAEPAPSPAAAAASRVPSPQGSAAHATAVTPEPQAALVTSQVQQSAPAADANRPTEFRCPPSGTVVEYNTGALLTFSSGNGFVCSYTDRTGAREKIAGFADDAAYLKAGLDRLWPLVIGAQQAMNVSTGSVSSASYSGATERFTVLRREVVAVPAGTFYAVVVEQEETASGNSGVDAKRDFWWAPDLGLVVKSTYLSIRDTRYANSIPITLLPGDYMAVRISVPGQAPGVAAPPSAAALTPAALPSTTPPLPAPTIAAAPAPPSSAGAVSARGRAVQTVSLVQQHGTFLVPIQLNGRITLDFVLDSGAADVAIPADVVLTLMRTGTLSDRDFVGTKTYVLADGSKLPSPSFVIHELRIGDLSVRNVTASVSPVQGDLLLGQSFLSKLPSWTIDNKQHALLIGQ